MTISTNDAQQWPPDYLNEFLLRLEWRNKLLDDDELRDAMQTYYASHCIEWINDFCVTFDPRAAKGKPRLMPFILFPRQRDFVKFILDCLQDKQSGLIEKSRDMGATWLCCAISIWLWLYHPGTVIGWGSLKEISVDKKGDPKAIFPKMRQILQNLPRFMLPAGYRESVDATYMKIINRENGAAIIGEAGDSMGRGGRTSIYFKDESAHYERAELVEAALGDNTDVQIDMSSVNGSANIFYRRRMAGEEWYPDRPPTHGKTRVFILDWRDHPGKSQQWHDEREAKARDEGLLHVFNQEVNRDYSGSIDGIVIPQTWVRAAVDAHIKLKFTDNGEKIAAQDVADGGADKNALGIRYDVVMKWSDHWGGEAGAAARHAIPIAAEWGCSELYYDSIGVGVGFKVEVNTMKKEPTYPKRLKVYAWSGGASVIDPDKPSIPGDRESPTNEQQYENLKAQGWFRLRARFYKTFMAITTGVVYPQHEMISLDSTNPRLHELMLQLSQATHTPSKKGKTMIEKKPDGASSPNLADQCVMCYCPVKPPRGFFDV